MLFNVQTPPLATPGLCDHAETLVKCSVLVGMGCDVGEERRSRPAIIQHREEGKDSIQLEMDFLNERGIKKREKKEKQKKAVSFKIQ